MSTGIAPQLTVAEVLERWPVTVAVFVWQCMACVGCAMAPFDTVGEAAAVYGIQVQRLLDELHEAAAGEEKGGQR